jgi:hypothetical protein
MMVATREVFKELRFYGYASCSTAAVGLLPSDHSFPLPALPRSNLPSRRTNFHLAMKDLTTTIGWKERS